MNTSSRHVLWSAPRIHSAAVCLERIVPFKRRRPKYLVSIMLRAMPHRQIADRLLTSAGTSQHAPQGPRQKIETPSKPAVPKQKKLVTHKQGLLKSKSLKRTRSVAQGLALDRNAVTADTNPEDAEPTVEVVTEESHTFYIGDIDALKEFLTRRFDELTMKPLRGIATHWIKLIEPRRLGDWGKYHEMKPSEAETPPWWPQDVVYKEPSHLKKEGKFGNL